MSTKDDARFGTDTLRGMSSNPTFVPGLLKGKVAFVTGGGSGITRRIAERLAEAGAKVGVLGRTPEKLEDTVKTIRAAGGEAKAFPADVREYAAVDKALAGCVEAFGPIDILVNGAAGNFPAPALGMSANGFKSVVDIDLLGTFNVCRAAFDKLKKPGASVINISASQAFQPAMLQVHVCAAKAGVDMVTRVLAMEWGGAGVRVNSVTPGPIDDTEGMKRLAPSEGARKHVTECVPLGRFGTTDDISDMCLFLCSPAASYVTGALMICDGGMHLGGSGQLMRGMTG